MCRPGGRIGLLHWTSPPSPWGDPAHVRALFAGTGVELEFARGRVPLRFPSAGHHGYAEYLVVIGTRSRGPRGCALRGLPVL